MFVKVEFLVVVLLGLVISAGLFTGSILLSSTSHVSRGSSPTMSIPSVANLTSPSPSIFARIDGIRQPSDSTNQGSRPDPQVAAGPNSVVEMANLNVEVFSKQGVSLKNSTFAQFFNANPNVGGDPRVIYDAPSGRWFATMSADVMRLAVSNSSDPTGNWTIYKFPFGSAFDQPSLGITDDKVVISSNSPNSGFSLIRIINKSELLAGCLRIDNVSSTLPYLSVHPVQSLSPTATEYMVSTGAGLTSVNVTHLYAIIGTPPATPVIALTNLTIAPTAALSSDVEGYDSRVQDAAWFRGKLWYALNDACPQATCIRLTEINTNTSRVVQDFNFEVTGQSFWYPALKIDGDGGLDVVYGNGTGIAVTGQTVNDPPGTLRNPATLKGPSGSIPGTVNSGYLYGDYFGAGVDPTDPRVVWVAGEYIPVPRTQCAPGSELNCWGTFIGSMSVQPPSLTSSINPAMLNMTAPAPGSMRTGHANLTVTSHAFSGQVTLSNSPNYETALSGPLLSYSQTNFNMTPGQTISIVVSVAICSSTPSRTFTITGSSGALTSNVTFIVNVTGQRSGSCPS